MPKSKKLNISFELLDNDYNKIGVKIKFKDFEKFMEKLEDLHDIYYVYKRRSKTTKTIPLEQVKEELFGNHAKK